MALFHFPKVRLLLVDLFDHKDREILQGVAFGIEMTSHWLFQTSMFNESFLSLRDDHPLVDLCPLGY